MYAGPDARIAAVKSRINPAINIRTDPLNIRSKRINSKGHRLCEATSSAVQPPKVMKPLARFPSYIQ